MSDYHREYWEECLSIASEECGVVLAGEQLSYLVNAVQGSQENFGMAFGYDVASENLSSDHSRELEDTRKQLSREINKVTCSNCGGRGYYVLNGPCHSTKDQCFKCSGQGRHDP